MFNFEVCAYLFKIKEGENFNRRRPEGSALGVNGVFRGLKFEPVETKRRSRSSGTQISD